MLEVGCGPAQTGILGNLPTEWVPRTIRSTTDNAQDSMPGLKSKLRDSKAMTTTGKSQENGNRSTLKEDWRSHGLRMSKLRF